MVNNGYYASNRMKFGPRVQERAWAIFNRDGVHLRFFDGKQAKATVQGSKLYEVELEFSPDGRITNHHCTCPVHDNYNAFCKHEIATLLALDKNGKTLLDQEKDPSLYLSPSDKRGQVEAFLLALEEARKKGKEERIEESQSVFENAKASLDRSAMFELALRFCVNEMQREEAQKNDPVSFLLVHSIMDSLPIPEQKSILRDLYGGKSEQAKSAVLALLSSYPISEELSSFFSALIGAKDLLLIERLERGAYFALFPDPILAKLLRYTSLSSLPKMPNLIAFIEERRYWQSFASMLLFVPSRLHPGNAEALFSLFSRLPKEKGLFTFLYHNILRSSYETSLLKYFHSFPQEERLELFDAHRQFLDSEDPRAYQLCAGVYVPERLMEFYHFSPSVLAICKEDLLAKAPEQTSIAVPKFLDREMKKLRRQKRVEEDDLLEVLDFIEAYSSFPEVTQTLRDPLLDQWTFHYGAKARIRYLLLLQEMPSFIGMRRF